MSLGKEEGALDSFFSAQSSATNNTDGSYQGQQYQDVFGKLRYRLSDDVELKSSALLSYDRNQVALADTDSPIKNDFIHASLSANVKMNEQSNLSLTGHFSQFNHFLKYTDSLDKYDNQGRVYGFSSQY